LAYFLLSFLFFLDYPTQHSLFTFLFRIIFRIIFKFIEFKLLLNFLYKTSQNYIKILFLEQLDNDG